MLYEIYVGTKMLTASVPENLPNCTLHMKRHMGAESLCIIKWWADASYGVHWDSKGHTGATMSMGKGAMVNISRKHKLNVGSSTESELVSIADVLGMMMWCKYFMEAQ